MQDEQDREEDKKFFEAWISGSSVAFTKLYEKYKYRIYAFLIKMTHNKELAEDILQETFFAALRNAKQFDKNRNLLSWLFGIAHKKTIDHFRHVKVQNNHLAEAENAVGSRLDRPDDATNNKYVRKVISEALSTLDPLQKEVFLLREVGGVSFKDIAVIMGCPLNTALGRMRLALKNIRKELEKRGVHGV